MKFEEGNIYFSKIIVIQSLPDDERQTGTEIHDDIIRRRAWFDPNLKTELIDISSKSEFHELLEKIKYDARRKVVLPYIHFETHGTKDGIVLKSNEGIQFKEFLPTIREINCLTKNNLFISVGACWGGRIQFETDISKPCPFRGFIGPMDRIYPEDMLISFTAFFDELLVSNDFEKAIKRLNLYNNSEVKFHHWNSESFFEKVIAFQNENFKNDASLRESRIKYLVKKFWKNDPRAKEVYKTKGRFKKMVRRLEKNEVPLIYTMIKENFLHVKYKNSH